MWKLQKGQRKTEYQLSSSYSLGKKKKVPGEDTPPWVSKELHLLADAAHGLLLPTSLLNQK